MRALAVINGLGTGGAERSLAESIEPLAARGIEIEIAVLHRRPEGVQDSVEQATTVHELQGGARDKIASLRKLVRTGSFELVHSTLFEADVLVRLATLRRTPVLTSLVNTSYDKTRLDDDRIRRTRFEGARAIDALTGRASRSQYHALTQAVAQSAVTRLHVPEQRITVIPRGRDAARLGTRSIERRAASRRALGIDQDVELIVSVGRQEYQKGQGDIIEALGRLKHRARLQLMVAGREGNASADLAAAVDTQGVRAKVRFLGHVDNVPDLLVAADLLLFPSRFEGLGGTLIEAMALETPVITSELPVTREVMGPAAMFVNPGDPGGLARATAHLLDDPLERERLGSAGRARFLDKYQLDQVMDQMTQLMNRVARG